MENNKRLIDANVLTEMIQSLTMVVTGLRAEKGILREYAEEYQKSVLRTIDEAPTVDAVVVVRCEKCLYRSQYADENGLYKCGGIQTEDGDIVLMVRPEHFCSHGERRGRE